MISSENFEMLSRLDSLSWEANIRTYGIQQETDLFKGKI